jgi:cell wall-associated NlpC family hydrolase
MPVPSEIIWWGDKLPIAPLERRRFIWHVFHCWALARDWYRLEWGVTLPNFACDPDFVDTGHSIFLDNFERAGLRNLGKVDMSCLQVGDMLVGHVRGGFPNHCGIYVGGDDFLHHPPGAPSGTVNLLRWWPHIDTVMRYERQDATSARGTG